jgi:hypothetical protein
MMLGARIILLFAVAQISVLVPQGTDQNHAVRFRGRLEIPQTYDWDLDDGVVSQMGEEFKAPYDFWYEAVLTRTSTIHRYLVPGNGALLAVAGDRAIGYTGCRSSALSDKAVALDSLPKGTFLCARTDEGRYSEFSVDDLYPNPPGSNVLTLAITVTTWE